MLTSSTSTTEFTCAALTFCDSSRPQMDSLTSKGLCRSPFLHEVLPQRIGRCSIRQTAGRRGREAARAVQEIQYSPEERVSDNGIAAARSYISILDTMIIKKFSLMS